VNDEKNKLTWSKKYKRIVDVTKSLSERSEHAMIIFEHFIHMNINLLVYLTIHSR